MAIIYLVGMRGSGKTTVGKILARLQATAFLDLDQFLSQEEDASIREIVARQGWPGFRQLEQQYLRRAAKRLQGSGIVATGGGIVLEKANRQFMRSNGRVVWLAAPVEVLCNRLVAEPLCGQRPSLTGSPLLEELEQTARERDSLYRESAHLILSAEEEPAAIARKIQAHLAQFQDTSAAH